MKVTREAKAGLFVLVILIVFYWGVSFLKGIDVLSSRNVYYALYSKTDNIEVSSPVLIKGIKIGTVTNIALEGVSQQVKITMTVSGKYPIPANSNAVITNKSMLGGKAINIEIGDSNEFLKNKDTIAGKIDNNVQEQIDEFKGKALAVIDELTLTLANVNKVLDDQNIKNISSTVANINDISEQTKHMLNRESDKLSVVLSNLETVTGEFKDKTPLLLANLTELSDSLKSADIATTIRSAHRTIDELNITIEAINSRKGSVGKLLYDPSLYNNLDAATNNLSLLLADLKSNPKRYVHFSVFGGGNKNKNKNTDSK